MLDYRCTIRHSDLSPSLAVNFMSSEDSDWNRVAQLVTSRRLELGYRRQEDLARAMDVSLRVLNNIENARRSRYSRGTLALLEQTLDWRSGSIEAVLDGGDPVPLSQPAATYRDREATDEDREQSMREAIRDVQERLDKLQDMLDKRDQSPRRDDEERRRGIA